MPPSPQTYLVRKSHLKHKALTVRIPLDVHEALSAARQSADGAGFVFDVQAVVVEALERAVQRVMGDLKGEQVPNQALPGRARRIRAVASQVPDVNLDGASGGVPKV
jgi:hypothetical protein